MMKRPAILQKRNMGATAERSFAPTFSVESPATKAGLSFLISAAFLNRQIQCHGTNCLNKPLLGDIYQYCERLRSASSACGAHVYAERLRLSHCASDRDCDLHRGRIGPVQRQ